MDAGYSAQIFIPNDESVSVESVNQRLVACLKSENPNRIRVNEGIPTSGNSITGYWNNWSLTAVLSDAPHVAEENQEMAEDHSLQPPFDVIGKCKRRIELWSAEDPNMNYFNIYIGVLEEMEKQFEDPILMGEDGQM